MKKIFMSLMLFLALLPVFAFSASAYDDEITESIADEAGANDIKSDILDEDELTGDKSVNIFEKAWDIILNSFSDNGMSVIGSLGLILSVIIICCVMHAFKLEGGETLDNAVAFISVLALAGVVYSVLYNLFILVIASMETLTLTMSSLLPTMASLYAFGGNAAAGAASVSGLTIFIAILSLICTKIIMPLLQTAFALALSGAIPGSINLTPVNNLVKNTATTVMAFIFTLLGFVLYIQTIIAAAGDNFVSRSVRFASGVFVPVIGGILGDASRTVIASASVIKGTVGAAGIVTILSIVLPPLILTVLHKLMLLVCAIAAKALGCERESALLYDLGGVLSVLLALVIGAGSVCIIGMALFIKVGVNA